MKAGKDVGGEEQALYQCSRCRRRYHRAEHLARHVRSVHTKQRPYACRVCGKGFGRLDVLRRHEVNTHGGGGGGLPEPETAVVVVEGDDKLSREVEGSERVRLACKGCKVAKVKCSERKPCARCVGRGGLCEVEGENCVEGGPGSDFLDEVQAVPEDYTQTRLDDQRALDETAPAMMMMMMDDFSFGAEWNLAMSDLSYLQTRFDTVGPEGLEVTASDGARLAQEKEQEQEQNGGIGMSISPPMTPESHGTGSWEPSSDENSEMERPHLAADEESLKAGGTPRTPETPDFGWCSDGKGSGVVDLSISPAARNAIVGMILDNTSRANAGPVIAAFPSVGALDALLGAYAGDCWGRSSSSSSSSYCSLTAAGKYGIIDVVHLPTLRLDQQRPELLGALIAVGAIRAGSAVARRFGHAMQDVWEKNHANLCDISLSQAFFLQQHIAFFSSIRRKVAFAEACSGCMQVMMKNGGHIQGAMETDQALYQAESLYTLNDGALEDVWRRWSVREARRRLVYAVYIMDSHVGITHGIRGMARYGDMRLPLPAPAGLWRAESAVKWREEMVRSMPGSTISPSSSYASSSLSPALSLRDLMGDPTLIARSYHRSRVNQNFVALGFYAGLWALVEECRQLKAISGHGQWSAMILSSRRMELGSMLKLFESSLRAAGWAVAPASEMMYEVLHMYISTSMDGDELRGTGMSPSLSQQIHSEASANGIEEIPEDWVAVWRAGKVLRAARRLEPGTLSGVYCVALRDATVLLCRFGRSMSLREKVVMGQHRPRPGCGTGAAAVLVLDGEKDVQEYQVLDRNVHLMLRGTGTEEDNVEIEDVAGVIRLSRRIIKGNWKGSRMPGGVEEVYGLLDGLGKASGP
ncbi:hypothetical protein Landi51_03190 [Colletotrichum acutatum]